MAADCYRSPTEATPDSRAQRVKARLFCPECGHESGVGGDWRVTGSETGRTLSCPECGAVVVER